jgi:O-antigen ligase
MSISSSRVPVKQISVWLVLAGLLTGFLVATVNPLILFAAAVAIPLGAWTISSVERALFALIVVIGLLPRFALPVRLGFTPTFLDLAMIGLIAAWIGHQLGRSPDKPLRRTPVNGPLAALVTTAVLTFILGLPNGALAPLVVRRFAELLLSLITIVVIVAITSDLAMQRQVARWTLLIGAASAALGIALYAIPDYLAIRLLSALRPFGYPSGPEVLRFIQDDPALMQRATGLWIDPNAYGGYLLIVGLLGLPHLFASRPALARWLVFLALALVVVALVLTVSRAAMLGFALGALVIGLLRHRSVLLILGLIGGAVLLLPQTQALVQHFVEGFQGRDLATQMRFGEYKDALRLIERYPLLGVGFIGTPDVDLYIGVSSMYLLIAQQMGLVGLAMFIITVVVVLFSAMRAWPAISRASPEQTTFFLGAHGALIGALFSGIFDHYFFNIDFHNSVMLLCLVIGISVSSQQIGLTIASAQRSVHRPAQWLPKHNVA